MTKRTLTRSDEEVRVKFAESKATANGRALLKPNRALGARHVRLRDASRRWLARAGEWCIDVIASPSPTYTFCILI